jgi:hypothetical protein
VEDSLAKSYFEYNPDEDSNGSLGIEIAEILYKRCGKNFDKIKKWIFLGKHRRELEEIASGSL